MQNRPYREVSGWPTKHAYRIVIPDWSTSKISDGSRNFTILISSIPGHFKLRIGLNNMGILLQHHVVGCGPTWQVSKSTAKLGGEKRNKKASFKGGSAVLYQKRCCGPVWVQLRVQRNMPKLLLNMGEHWFVMYYIKCALPSLIRVCVWDQKFVYFFLSLEKTREHPLCFAARDIIWYFWGCSTIALYNLFYIKLIENYLVLLSSFPHTHTHKIVCYYNQEVKEANSFSY